MSDSTPPPPPPPPPPPYGAAGERGYPPPNYLVWAILTTVLLCVPLGVVSIVFSTQVNTKWAMGDVAGARAASGRAKTFAIWGAIVGVLLDILSLAFIVLLHRVSAHLNTVTG